MNYSDDNFTIAEVARATRLSVPTIHWHINRGTLKATYKFRQYHITAADLTAFLQARARE